MKPSIGRTIRVAGPLAESNGAKRCAGVVTRVWSEEALEDGSWMINATLFPDNAHPALASSIRMFFDQESALEYLNDHESATVAFWPPRDPS